MPRSCLIADRAWNGDAFRAWRAQRDIKAVIPARSRRTSPQPHALERYKARNAGERGLGGRKGWRRVAPIRAAVPGFAVPGGGLDLAEILYQHDLKPARRWPPVMRRGRPRRAARTWT